MSTIYLFLLPVAVLGGPIAAVRLRQRFGFWLGLVVVIAVFAALALTLSIIHQLSVMP